MTTIAQRKGMSILMIMLVLYLPMHTSLVLGAGLLVERVEGGDGIEDFRRQNDQTTIVVRASLDTNDTLEPSQLTATLSGLEYAFSNCESMSSNQYRCTYTDFEPNSLQPLKHTYTITLSDGSNTIGAVGATITVDNKGPIIQSFTIDASSQTSAENATLSYRLKDPAYTPIITGVGVATARITLNGEEIETLGGENDSMELSGDIDVTLGGEGNKEFCIEAEDLYGQKSDEECISVFVDRTAPTATFVNFTNPDEGVFEWVSNQNYPAFLSVRINGSDVDSSSVRGNLVGLSGRGTDTSVVPTYCNEEEDAYLCIWNTFLYMNTTGSRSFIITYSDETGNSAEVTLSTYSINADVTGPKWIGIDTDFVEDENSNSSSADNDLLDDYRRYFTSRPGLVLGKDIPTLVYQFSEQGIGLNDTLVYADLNELIGKNNVQTDNCSLGWNCYFYDLDLDSISVSQSHNATVHEDGSITIKFTSIGSDSDYTAKLGLNPQSSDDLGNFVDYDETFTVDVDLTPPIIDVMNVTPLFATGDFIPYIVAGDSYIVEVTLTDSSPVLVYYKGEEFGVNSSIAPCSSIGNSSQECSFTLPISEEGYYEGALDLTFIDYVGNTVEHSVTLPVYAVDENVEPDYWKVSGVTCSPNALDRTIIPLTNYKAYCSVQFIPTSGEASIRDMQFGNCQEKGFGNTGGTNGTGYMTQNDLLQIGTPNPILELVLGQFDASEISALEFTCPISIKSQRGNYLTRNYEYENVTVRLDMYDGLGQEELSEEVKDEIMDVYDNYVDSAGWELISTVEEFLEFSQKICHLLNVLGNVGQLLANIGFLIRQPTVVQYGLSLSMPLVAPAVTPVAEGTNSASSGIEITALESKKGWTAIYSILAKYCYFVDCQLYYGDNAIGAWQAGVTDFVNSWVYLNPGNTQAPNDPKPDRPKTNDATEKKKETSDKKDVVEEKDSTEKKSEDKKEETGEATLTSNVVGDEGVKEGSELNGKGMEGITGMVTSTERVSTSSEPLWQTNVKNKLLSDLIPAAEESELNQDFEEVDVDTYLATNNPTWESIAKENIMNDIKGESSSDATDAVQVGEAKVPDASDKDKKTKQPKKKETLGKKAGNFVGGLGYLGANMNPKDNYIMSVITLCVPGIIHNLHKYRQIQCMYADCLLSSAEGGIPVSICEDQKAYSECKFFWGPVFQLIPFSGFIDRLSEIVKNILANPLLAIDIIVENWLCEAAIAGEQNAARLGPGFYAYGPTGFLCILYSTIDLVLQLQKSVESFEDDFFEFGGQDYCENVEKGVKDLGLNK